MQAVLLFAAFQEKLANWVVVGRAQGAWFGTNPDKLDLMFELAKFIQVTETYWLF